MPNPGLDSARQLVAAVKDGWISEEAIDTCVDRMLNAILTLSENKKKRQEAGLNNFDKEKHHELARHAAAESAVLLKNSDEILPLKTGMRVAVIGDFAFEPRYQGAGSSSKRYQNRQIF